MRKEVGQFLTDECSVESGPVGSLCDNVVSGRGERNLGVRDVDKKEVCMCV